MSKRIRYGFVLALVLFLNVTPAFAIYNDCSQYMTMTYTDARGVQYCNFCTFQGGWSDMETGDSVCDYKCFGFTMCRTV
ncbi:MAG TPA: hypothetical protein VEK11_08835 [Thermoanaerobaculia bacterium]|nr:hypothetical protein [Thermoanaerobaculia bacterium]